MKVAPPHPREAERLLALERAGLLDTLPEAEFDEIALIAAQICGAPIALISLVDAKRQWFKARVGSTLREAPRELAFCAHAILEPGLFVVPDTHQDTRFSDNPVVTGSANVHFYAGAPLLTDDGLPLGALCVMDRQARSLSAEQATALSALARQVMTLIALRAKVAALDVTNRALAQASAALAESESRFRLLADQSGEMIVRYAPDGTRRYVSPASSVLLGVPPDALVGSNGIDIVHPDDRLRVTALLGRMLQGEVETGALTYRSRRADGAYVWFETTARALRDDRNGAIVEVHATTRNVNARVVAEAALAESEARFRNAFEAGVLGIALLGVDGRFLQANRSWCDTLGYTEAELLAKRLDDVAHPAEPGDHRLSRPSTSTGPAELAERRFVRKDGSIVWVSTGMQTLLDAQGNFLYHVAQFRDVTARRKAEERQGRFFALSLELLVIASMDGRARRINPSWERVLGFPAKHIFAHTFLDLVHPDDREATKAEQDRLRDGGTCRFECRLACADGSFRWIEWSMSVSLEDSLMYAVGRDVTDRKADERIKRTFVSMVSHELRTPLTSIRGALGLLEGGAVGALSRDAIEIVQIARTNCERLVRLVGDILDLDKIDAGKLRLSIAPAEPRRIVDAAVDGLRGFASSEGVTLKTEIDHAGELPLDEDRIIQVLTNLASNAIKFSPHGGSIRVRVASQAASGVRFEVIDAGAGIAPEDIGTLFRPFQQLGPPDARSKGGTGLGLSISKAIVEQHGGAIGVSSTLGQGSTFWFELPARPPHDREEEP